MKYLYLGRDEARLILRFRTGERPGTGPSSVKPEQSNK
jgi:hypothetical protein